MKFKTRIAAIILCCITAFSSFAQNDSRFDDPAYVNKVLSFIHSQISKTLPIQRSKNLILFDLTTGNREFTYHFQRLEKEFDDVSLQEFKQHMTQKLTQNICNDPSMKIVRRSHITVNYRYYNREKTRIEAAISIDTNKCH